MLCVLVCSWNVNVIPTACVELLKPFNVKIEDKVLLPEYGGTKVTLEDSDDYLFLETDILGKFEE